MSNENESFKAGFSFLLIVIVIVFVSALILGLLTGDTGKLLGKAANISGTIIWVVISGFILMGVMMLLTRKN